MTLDSFPLTPSPQPQPSPDEDYPTVPDRPEEYPNRLDERTTLRSDQESEPPKVQEEPIERPNGPEERPIELPKIPEEPEEPQEKPKEPQERPEEPQERSENPQVKLEEPQVWPEKPEERPDGSEVGPEEPEERPEESEERRDESQIRPEESTHKLEEATERPEEEITEKTETPSRKTKEYEERSEEPIEITEESRRIYVTERPLLRTPEYGVKNLPLHPKVTNDPSYSKVNYSINFTGRYKSSPNKTYTSYNKETIIKGSNVYIDNDFQEVLSKFIIYNMYKCIITMVLTIYLLLSDTAKPSFYEVPTIRVSTCLLIFNNSKYRQPIIIRMLTYYEYTNYYYTYNNLLGNDTIVLCFKMYI